MIGCASDIILLVYVCVFVCVSGYVYVPKLFSVHVRIHRQCIILCVSDQIEISLACFLCYSLAMLKTSISYTNTYKNSSTSK